MNNDDDNDGLFRYNCKHSLKNVIVRLTAFMIRFFGHDSGVSPSESA